MPSTLNPTERQTLLNLAASLEEATPSAGSANDSGESHLPAPAIRKAVALLDAHEYEERVVAQAAAARLSSLAPVETCYLTNGAPLRKPMPARKVAKARQVLAASRCSTLNRRHRYQPVGGIYFRCVGCGELV